MFEDLFQFNTTKGKSSIHIGNCLEFLKDCPNQYDAIITDPPYELEYMGAAWDATGISFSKELWELLYKSVKPGGFIVAFGASRYYHKLASAAQDVNLKIYPMLTWEFPSGLPKPVNVSELFDRDNIKDRKPIGYKKGSGFTTANGVQGAQQRLTERFPVYERGVSDEAKKWKGYYYGNNTLKPAFEPILLAQRPISTDRMIDNLRIHGTGALNIDALKAYRGNNDWPATVFRHAKAKAKDHDSSHPSVKPVLLMTELCLLACPTGGHILDPFAGTGTTGIAATNAGFDCTLIEQNPEMEPVIRRRLA